MPSINIKKIYIEQNKGFFKGIRSPHVENNLNIVPARENSGDFVLKVKAFTVDGEITNSRERALRNLSEKNIQQKKKKEKRILATKHVVIPLVINDETNQAQMNLVSGYVSTFKRNIEKNTEYVLELESEKVEELNSRNNTEVTKREYGVTIRLPKEPRNLYLLYGSYSVVEVPTSIGKRRQIRYESISYETIMERGELKTEVDVFQLQDGKVWSGPIVRTDKNLIFTGEKNPSRLQQKKALNTKLIDLTVKSKINRKKENFKNSNDLLLTSRINQVQKRKSNFYFSDIFINQKNRVASCFFFFNDKRFILDNCLLSKLYENVPENLSDLVLVNSNIVSLKLYRRRVKKSGRSKNRLSDVNESFELFDGEKEELIAETKQEGNNSFVTATDNLKQIFSLNYNLNQQSRMFKFEDNYFLDKNEGMYQYRVEVQIDDFSIEIIKDDIKKLQTILKDLKIYSDMRAALEKNKGTNNLRSLQNAKADSYLNTYFNTLNKYFINEDLFNQDGVFKLKQTLKAQIVSNSREATGILNFIKLVNDLISDLAQLISKELFSFDNPHIDLVLNEIEKNSKRVISIENEFSNDVVDASMAKIKNINFFSSSRQRNYDEFNFQQFSNLLIQLKNSGRIKQDRILPSSVTQGEFGFFLNGERKQYPEKTQATKYKRQNLLNSNVNVSVIQQENIDDEKNYLYENYINSFFDFVSFNFVRDKTIDETSSLFSDPNNPSLIQFEGEIQILSSTSQNNGSWVSLRDVNNLPSEYGNYLLCRVRPRKGNENNKNWDSLSNIVCTDSYFFVKIENKEESARLVQVLKSVMPTLKISATPFAENTLAISRIRASNLSYREVENFFFR